MPERVTEDSIEHKLRVLSDAIWNYFDQGQMRDFGLVATFTDAAIVKDWNTDEYYEIPYIMDGTSDVLLGEPKPVKNTYVTKKLITENPDMTMEEVIARIEKTPAPIAKKNESESGAFELTGPIVKKNAAKRIAYAAVLVPGETDHDGESVTKAKVEAAAHEWMESYRNVDLQHTLTNIGVPIESYLLPMEMTVKAVHGQKEMTLPEGTWILGSRLDEATFDAVEKGDLTGYSIMGMRRAAVKSTTEDAALKKTLLKDLGDDWVPTHVSVVNEPAVPKAKFFALKTQETDTTIIGRIKAAFENITMSQAEKEGRRYSQATVSKLKAAADAIMDLVAEAESEAEDKSQKGGLIEMTPEEIKEVIATAIKEATEPMIARIDGLEAGIKAAEAVKGEETEAQEAEAKEEINADLEAFKSEVSGKLEILSQKLGGTKATALKGQDGDEQEEPAAKSMNVDRDPYGRKMKTL